MPPTPPSAPLRGRSRSRDRFQARVAGVIAAHRRNLHCRRAGRKGQAARRTRAIHKHLLGILLEYLGQLLTGFTRRPPPEVIARKRQAEVRWSYLEDGNFPSNKYEVLPGLREFVRDNHDWKEQLGSIVILPKGKSVGCSFKSLTDNHLWPIHRLWSVGTTTLFWTHSEFHPETLSRPLQASIQGQPKTCLQLCTVCLATSHRLFARIVTETILSRTSYSVPLIKQNLPRSSLPVSHRKPTGEQGKLTVLRSHFSLSTVLIHVDDSPEVLSEIREFIDEQGNTCNWRVVGMSVRSKRKIPGVHYCINVRKAL